MIRKDHPLWAFVAHFGVRGVLAAKLMYAASVLGPSAIGLVAVATVTLAIVDGLSETGLAQAIVQSKNPIADSEAGAIWTIQLARGGIVATILLLLARSIASLFAAPAATTLVMICALSPLVRGMAHPGIFIRQRDRDFRCLSIADGASALMDLLVTVTMIRLTHAPESILFGALAGDLTKSSYSWVFLRIPLRPSLKWRKIDHLTGFGKWIWGSSVLTLILNQVDKVILARLLSTTELGLYQLAVRVSQLALADVAAAISQFMYPRFAQLHRASPKQARRYLARALICMACGGALIALCVGINAAWIISRTFGEVWLPAASILRVLLVPMFIGTLIIPLVAYLRSSGRPHVVVWATAFQLLILVIFGPALIPYFRAEGMAWALAVAGACSAAYLAYRVLMKGSL